jgi:transcription elongation factor Elf1
MWEDKRKIVQRTCKNCDKSFDFKPSQLNAYPNAGKYCSRKCGYEYRVRKGAIADRGSGALTNLKGDKEWQRLVRERDGSICQRCGEYQKHIHTHHIAPRSQRPDLKQVVDNGVCLCGSCHQWVHHHPIEAEKLGFLSGAKYELERLEQRYRKRTIRG